MVKELSERSVTADAQMIGIMQVGGMASSPLFKIDLAAFLCYSARDTETLTETVLISISFDIIPRSNLLSSVPGITTWNAYEKKSNQG